MATGTEDISGTVVTEATADKAAGPAGRGPISRALGRLFRRKPRNRVRRHHRPRIGALLVLSLVLIALVVGGIGMALTGKALRLPVWAVAEVESRLNAAIGSTHLPPGAALSLGGAEITLDRDFVPRFRLSDLRLLQADGQSLLALPDLRLSLDPTELLHGRIRPGSLRLSGARIAVERDAEGRIGLTFGGMSGLAGTGSLATVLDALDRMFSTDQMAGLSLIEADALTVTMKDLRAGRTWEMGDGRLIIENRSGSLAAELGVTLLDGQTPAQARLTIETDKTDSSARIWATIDQIAAADLAAQAPPLTFLEVVKAPISGRLMGDLGDDGQLARMEGWLKLSAGAIQPSPDAAPVAFDAAEIALRYDPLRQRVTLGSLSVESAALRLKARGHADLLDATGAPAAANALPAAVVGQLSLTDVKVDPAGLFVEPVRFSQGALDMRVTLRPFKVEIGQFVLTEAGNSLQLDGTLAADKTGGWQGALDVALDRITTDRLMKLWPVSVVPMTRDWLQANVGQGELTGVNASLRFAPGTEPRFALDYDFSETEVRFIRTLPPVQDGHGRAGIEGNTYTIVLDGGHVTAPDGGRIAVDGSVLKVLDIRARPAVAEVHLLTASELTPALSLLDQEPFHFLSKAERPVNLGQGRAELVADLRFPLKAKIMVEDVDFDVSGRILDFRSDIVVPGHVVASPDMAVKVTPKGISLAGEGKLDRLPFVGRYTQAFGPEVKGKADVRGDIRVSDKALRDFGIGLPEGWLSGETSATVELALQKGAPGTLTLTSDLTGATLNVGALSWSKPAKAKGSLSLDATLGSQPEITRMALSAPGLKTEGRLTTRAGGGLDKVVLPSLQVGDWLDAAVEITGKGAGKPVDTAITGGSIDLRTLPKGQASGGGRSELTLALDQLIVSSGIRLTGFQGAFLQRDGGLDGRFSASVNGRGAVNGAVVPTKNGTAVRLTSDNAGTVMAAAGIFAKGRGGTLDLTLQPRGKDGHYSGVAAFSRLSVQGAPALAELLGAISVVGLLEQMNGDGIFFNEGDVEFEMSPGGVQIRRGAAVGASLGISFAGLYRSGSGELDLQGVISPVYLLNGIGQIFARKGEGLFGFNYSLTGTAENPSVSVNPLSILTPGMFRDIFRRPAPVLEESGG